MPFREHVEVGRRYGEMTRKAAQALRAQEDPRPSSGRSYVHDVSVDADVLWNATRHHGLMGRQDGVTKPVYERPARSGWIV